MINASTKIYGIIGNPVSHSLSPLLQNTLANEMNIDMKYMAFHVKENIEDAIKGAFFLDIKGFNITVPYKRDVLSIVDEIDERAKKIGAINTLVKTSKGYRGYNTDIIGLCKCIKNNGLSIKDRDIILLGAGGAAKAALYLAIEEGARSITIVNRNIIDDNEFYKKCDSGIDLIYTPFETAFIKKMKENGKICINGLDMLILQGVESFEIWNDVKVSEDIIKKVKVLLTEKLRERMG